MLIFIFIFARAERRSSWLWKTYQWYPQWILPAILPAIYTDHEKSRSRTFSHALWKTYPHFPHLALIHIQSLFMLYCWQYCLTTLHSFTVSNMALSHNACGKLIHTFHISYNQWYYQLFIQGRAIWRTSIPEKFSTPVVENFSPFFTFSIAGNIAGNIIIMRTDKKSVMGGISYGYTRVFHNACGKLIHIRIVVITS